MSDFGKPIRQEEETTDYILDNFYELDNHSRSATCIFIVILFIAILYEKIVCQII